MKKAVDWFPIIGQFARYSYEKSLGDIIAAVVVTVMLIPQSLAYATLAGLPPHYGLYASIVPVVVYALLGSSTTLAVGPVAIASIMTASTLSSVASVDSVSYANAAITLAFLAGGILVCLGLLRFGFIANFLSHSVVSGFITASGITIALGQLRPLLGINASGHTFAELCSEIPPALSSLNVVTSLIGVTSLVFLVAARMYAARLFQYLGAKEQLATSIARMSPIFVLSISTALVAIFALDQKGVAIVGNIPSGIANISWPVLDLALIKKLFFPAFLIAIIGYVESISVGTTLGEKRDEKIDVNQELIAIGSSNIASGLAGAFPVTGGFSRSVVNFDAGAQTQLAGIFTAIGIAIASLWLTPYLYNLPHAMLAAMIIVAVLPLVDFSIFEHAWRFSRSDFFAVLLTVLTTLFAGVEAGVAGGIAASILLQLYHTSKPHIAEIGLVPKTEHFRNIKHYKVECLPDIVSLRIDESLLFSNARYLANYITDILSRDSNIRHIVLHCGGINTIDLTGMKMLQSLNKRLLLRGVQLHLSEVKTPVKNLLEKTDFISALGGQLFMTHLQAYRTLEAQATMDDN